MSVFSYNGTTLAYPETLDFNQVPVRDPQGDTDWHLEKYDIKVRSIIDLDYLPTIAPDLVGVQANPSEIMQAIKYRLELHRKPLSVTFNGKEYIPARQGGNRGTVDAKNGPKPQLCQVFQLTNTSWLLNYHIVAHYWQNNTAPKNGTDILNINNQGNNVLYNRWTESVEMDELQMTTRVREGQYAIRSDNVDGQTADELRSNMAVVSVPAGFIRKSSQYGVTEDGLVIRYRVADEEQYKMPTAPAFKADGYYFERATKFLSSRIGEVRVKLWGAKNSNQKDMIANAIYVATQKLKFRASTLPVLPGPLGVRSGWSIIDDAGLRVDLYKNYVEFFIRVWAASDIDRYAGIAAFYKVDTVLPDPFTANPNPTGGPYTPAYLDRGTGQFLLQAAAYYDPNLRNTLLSTGNLTGANQTTSVGNAKIQLSNGRQPGQAGANP